MLFSHPSPRILQDTISNSVRVIKTYRQTAAETISYAQCVKDVVAKDGITGLMFRGLKTRILANGLQGIIFSVAWKLFEEQFNKRADAKRAEAAAKKE
jgi:Mitochondrial carrier protein